MSNAIINFTPTQMLGMAKAFVDSQMFGVRTVAEAYSLMLIAQAEGSHPAIAARDYHVIKGRPTLKADAMMARFQQAGGVVEWDEISDHRVAARFSHPTKSPKPVLIEWTDETVTQAQISSDMHKKYPRQMKRARVISEGVRTVLPECVCGVYAPEEIATKISELEEIERDATATMTDRPPQEHIKEADYSMAAEPVTTWKDEPADVKAMGAGFDRVPPPAEPEAAALADRINGPEIDPEHQVPTAFKPKRKMVKLADLDYEHAERALKLAKWQVEKTDEFGAQWKEGKRNIPVLEKLLLTMPKPAAEPSDSLQDAPAEPEATTDTPEVEPDVLTVKHKVFVRGT